ncbi:MAG: NAD(P)-dependent alcohol dehydrogenase [Bacteroidetes bacterium]|nr:NAD(P)-dependent alcohol dehydrogenase [Bacteroidota bacterium]HET6244885.1 NAD(P)-dependent alcohol dehydrogenase [Bacteroidia bacterium]
MKAVVIYKFGGPEVLKVSEVEYPKLRNDGIIIKVLASSVNPIDCKIREGFHTKQALLRPLFMGYDIAGEVIEIGNDVKKIKVGDFVYGNLESDSAGAYSHFAQVRENAIANKPDNISFFEAASIPYAGLTALQSLRDYANLQAGEKILINGASGGVGSFAVQLAKEKGAKVTAVCNAKHTTMMQELNPDYFLDYNTTDFTKQKEKYDVIFDVKGNKNFDSCYHLLNSNGRYVTTEPTKGGGIYNLFLKLTQGKSAKYVKMKSNADDLDFLTKMVKSNKIIVFVDSVFPLDALPQAHYYLENNHPNGKVAIDIGH